MFEIEDYKKLSASMAVNVYADVTRRDPCSGHIVRVKSKSVNAVVFTEDGTPLLRLDLWHIDDPRIKSHPELYKEVASAEERGVFELASVETERREVRELLQSLPVEQIKTLVRDVPALASDVEALKATVADLQKANETTQKDVQGLRTRVKELSR